MTINKKNNRSNHHNRSDDSVRNSGTSNEVQIYGIHAVQSVLNERPQDIYQIQYSKVNARIQAIIDQATDIAITVHSVESINISDITSSLSVQDSHQSNHQGIVARVKERPVANEQQLKKYLKMNADVGDADVVPSGTSHFSNPSHSSSPLWVIIDNVQDPQNLGAIIRNAESAGATAILLPSHNCAPINATTRKTSSGAVDLMPVFQVSNLKRGLELLASHGVWLMGLVAPDESQPQLTSIYQTDLTGAIGWVLGSEATGMRSNIEKQCDYLTYIPMYGKTQSLNVANAAAIALSETNRQRHFA